MMPMNSREMRLENRKIALEAAKNFLYGNSKLKLEYLEIMSKRDDVYPNELYKMKPEEITPEKILEVSESFLKYIQEDK